MWAARRDDEPLEDAGGVMARTITTEIVRSKTVGALWDVYNEWGGSFNHINAAAALVKCSKLPGGGRSSLVDKLVSAWLAQLPLSGIQQCSNVLWTCVRLGPGAVQRLWDPTWEQYVKLLQRNSAGEGSCVPQNVTNPLWACAKLRKQPAVDEVQLLLQTFLQPAPLQGAVAQDVANFVWALGALCRLPDWQGVVSKQDVQQLFGKQQLQLLACSDNTQNPANVLLGLPDAANMAAGTTPVISADCARQHGRQLLPLVQDRVGSWSSQHITNAMWACGELGLANEQFFAAAVAAAPKWLPQSTGFDLTQAASACAKLQIRDERFLLQILSQAGVVLCPGSSPAAAGSAKSSKRLKPRDIDSTVALCSMRVAEINMPQLAGPMRDLIAESGISKRPNTHPSNTGKLWVFHSWLLQHNLLDGKGLAGVLTQQQLQQGARGAAKFYGAQPTL
jgi:hypothetical protein